MTSCARAALNSSAGRVRSFAISCAPTGLVSCEKSCVCTTCHVLVRKGFSSLRPAGDAEEDQLGKAWGLEATSRLSCQVRIGGADLVIEIPRYTLNIAGH